MILKYVLGGAHLPISYRIQFNFLNIVPSAPHNLSFFIFLISFSASRYLVSRVSERLWVPAYFCVECCSLPTLLFLTMLPAPLPSSLLSIPSYSHSSFLLPFLCPSQGFHTPSSRRDGCSHSQSGESWYPSALSSNSTFSEIVCPPLSSTKKYQFHFIILSYDSFPGIVVISCNFIFTCTFV